MRFNEICRYFRFMVIFKLQFQSRLLDKESQVEPWEFLWDGSFRWIPYPKDQYVIRSIRIHQMLWHIIGKAKTMIHTTCFSPSHKYLKPTTMPTSYFFHSIRATTPGSSGSDSGKKDADHITNHIRATTGPASAEHFYSPPNYIKDEATELIRRLGGRRANRSDIAKRPFLQLDLILLSSRLRSLISY